MNTRYDSETHNLILVHDFSEIKWVETSGQKGEEITSMPKGLKHAIILGDPNKEGLCIMRVYYPPHFRGPPHFHPMAEHITVLQGNLYVGLGDVVDESKVEKFTEEAFISMPARKSHFSLTKDDPCIVESHVLGPWRIQYL